MGKRTSYRRGATGGAYALMVGLVSVVALTAVTQSGDTVDSLMTTTADAMGDVIAEAPSPTPEPTATPDLEPDAFDLADQSGVNPSTVITSNMVTITGIDAPAMVSISGDGSPEFSVNGDSFDATARPISAGETLQMRMTSSASLSGAVSAQITVGSISDDMTVTTAGSISAFAFTNCGQTGRNGPTQGTCDSAYSSTVMSGQVTIPNQGYQLWTVPYSGTYRLDLSGAGGGNATSYSYSIGRGARVQGDINFTAGDQLLIVVGQQGGNNSHSGGGGGGTFVTLGSSYSTSSIVAAAGGGGGEGASGGNGYDANTSTSGSASTNNSGSGSSGNGGSSSGSSGWGGAGSGFSTNGGSGGSYGGQSYAFRNGATGGPAQNSCGNAAQGGFGGGGGNGCWGGGGGGGYSGGGSGGAGGGSYTFGLSNLSTTTGYQTGHGFVNITYLGP